MASPEFSALKSRFATTVAPGSEAGLSLAEQRAASERFGDLATEPGGVDYGYGDAHGVRVLFITPRDASQRHVIQYLHGGGYQKCSVESHRKMVEHIAKAAGVVAVSVVPVGSSTYAWRTSRGSTRNGRPRARSS
jgi:acetyl esterase/lipase